MCWMMCAIINIYKVILIRSLEPPSMTINLSVRVIYYVITFWGSALAILSVIGITCCRNFSPNQTVERYVQERCTIKVVRRDKERTTCKTHGYGTTIFVNRFHS